MNEENRMLVNMAVKARDFAYAPYSCFKVGAALLSCEGDIYTGCNIENAAFSPTNCAERTAFFKAVSEGKKDFKKIAIVGGKESLEAFCPPCGVCRQVMMEFCGPDFEIILSCDDHQIKVYRLQELLPEGFGPGNFF